MRGETKVVKNRSAPALKTMKMGGKDKNSVSGGAEAKRRS